MRWKCHVAYDGTDFQGWQSQPNGSGVQDHLERRLTEFLCEPIRIAGAGRTDSGVHAEQQVFSFEADWKHGAEKLLKAFRPGLPSTVQVYHAEEAASDFHARFSAKGKRYRYQYFEGWADPFEHRYFWSQGNRKLDIDKMNSGAEYLLGEHDFSAFSASTGDDAEDNPIKLLSLLRVFREGNRVILETEGSGYMYKMVRSIAGCLRDVGIGKMRVFEVKEILESCQRTHRVQTAPPGGLFLERVYY